MSDSVMAPKLELRTMAKGPGVQTFYVAKIENGEIFVHQADVGTLIAAKDGTWVGRLPDVLDAGIFGDRDHVVAEAVKAWEAHSQGTRDRDLIKINPSHCRCGCGTGVGQKSRFRPGHDQRLKGMLLRAHRADRLIELSYAGGTTRVVTPEQYASEVLSGQGLAAWLISAYPEGE